MTRRRGPRLAVILVAAAFTALAGLAGLAGLAALGQTEGWRTRLAGEITVAIRPASPAATDAATVRATEILAGTEGVAEVRALDRARVAELLAPWTAGARGPDPSVLPRLIAVDLDPRKPARRQDLADVLNAAGLDAVVDDHQGWRRMTEDRRRQVAAGLVAALMLCAGGLAAIGVFAADQDIAGRRSALQTRIHLGDTALACLASGIGRAARDLGLGILLGVVLVLGLGLLTGLAAAGTPPAGLAVLAARLGVLASGAGVIALACACAAGARRIRELDP